MDFKYIHGEPIETSRTEVLFNLGLEDEQDAYDQLQKLLPEFHFKVQESVTEVGMNKIPTLVIENVILPRKYIFRLLRGEPICNLENQVPPVKIVEELDPL